MASFVIENSTWRCILLTILLFGYVYSENEEWNDDTEKIVPIKEIESVYGKTALLPCNIEPNDVDDKVQMVLWFKHKGSKPIYSFDIRGRPFNKALYWSDPDEFGPRAYFVTVSEPAALTLDNVTLNDEGVYRCRVDYKNTPTRNVRSRLKVIVPPESMLVVNSEGEEINETLGPLLEGSDILLTCHVAGGKPKPTIKWYINGSEVSLESDSYDTDGTNTSAQLKLTNIDRTWLNTTVKCQARNSRLVNPLERSFNIEMYLRPSSIEILDKKSQFTSDIEVSLRCITSGSRPTAYIHWYIDGHIYTRGKISNYSNSTASWSILRLAPLPTDDGAILTCRATNSEIPDSSIEDVYHMTVVYRPIVSLTLGSTLNPGDIKEGDDVYFECNIDSNPKAIRIAWYHNAQVVYQNVSAGIIISGNSLVLQRVSKENAGHYSCIVNNNIGETTSQLAKLTVQFAPTCSVTTAVQVLGAKLDDVTSVKCSVTADPDEVTFQWTFHNNGESLKVPTDRYSSHGTTSILQYRTLSERDYGTILCRAKNSVGIQKKPCVFQVVPAARPSPPRNCSALRSTSHDNLLYVICKPGYDGGMKQFFLLEALAANGIKYIADNVTLENKDQTVRMMVDIKDLVKFHLIDLVVYAGNSKGLSEPLLLERIKLIDDGEKTEHIMKVTPHFPWFTILLSVSLAILGIAFAALLIQVKRRSGPIAQTKRPKQTVVQLDSSGRRYVIAYPDKLDKDEKPDVINAKTEHRQSRVFLEPSDRTVFTELLNNESTSTNHSNVSSSQDFTMTAISSTSR